MIATLKAYIPHPLRRRLAGASAYLRGRRVVSAYASHHRDARRIFAGESGAPAMPALDRVGVRVLAPGVGSDLIADPGKYDARVSEVAAAVRARFDHAEGVTFFPRLPAGTAAPLTADIQPVANGDVIMMRLNDPLSIPGVSELSRMLGPRLEQHLFGSFAIVDRVFVYRSLVSRQTPRASWLWHYDNYPPEIVKVMIYLSDVTEDSAPFEYLRQETTGRALPGRPLAPGYGTGRFDTAAIEAFRARGYVPHPVTGPPGTMIVFGTNVVHRATLASRHHRDVLVLQWRPAARAGRAFADREWTGSFQHSGFNTDPADLHVRK